MSSVYIVYKNIASVRRASLWARCFYVVLMMLVATKVVAAGDIATLRMLDSLAQSNQNLDTVIKYANMELNLARSMNEIRYKAQALSYLSNASYKKSDLANACQYAFRAIVNADTIGDIAIAAENYYRLGNSYSKLQNSAKSAEFYNKSLDLFAMLGDTARLTSVYRSVGWSCAVHGMYREAEVFYNKALSTDLALNNVTGITEDHYRMGVLAFVQYDRAPSDSLLYNVRTEFSTAYSLAKQFGNIDVLQRVSRYIAIANLRERETLPAASSRRKLLLDSCGELLKESYSCLTGRIYDLNNSDVDKAWVRYLIASNLYDDAKRHLATMDSIYRAHPNFFKNEFAELYLLYAELYKSSGDVNTALAYTERSLQRYRDHSDSEYNIASATQSVSQAEFDMKMRERTIQQKAEEALFEERSNMHFLIIASVVVVLVLVCCLTFIVIKNNIRSRKVNALLDQKNQELLDQQKSILLQNDDLELQKELVQRQKYDLEKQNQLISKSNTELIDSLNYASVIQNAVMPSASIMNSIFGDHLVVYRPLKIVSGDFYWASQTGNLKLLAVGDCTGHGVPGAFLSMLGLSILSNLTRLDGGETIDAGHLLDDVRDAFENAMHQRGSNVSSSDGIDMAVVLIECDTMTMHYAGAFRPVIVIHDGVAEKLSPDRMPIGRHYKASEHFTEHIRQLSKGDAIYLYTDGITDQFGVAPTGETKKYSAKRLMALLTSIYRLPFSMQYTRIEMDNESWRKTVYSTNDEINEQTDDALLVGVRV